MDKNIFDYQDAIERVGDEELLYELLDDFLEFSDEILLDLGKAIKENNTTMVMNSGHTLKGTAANLSLPNLSELGLQIENAGKQKEAGKFEQLYRNLEKNVEEFKNFMRNR